MSMIDGLAGTLAGMKEDAFDAAKMAGGVVLGVSIAKFVDNFLAHVGEEKDANGVVTKVGPLANQAWVGGAVPVVFGLGLFAMGRGAFPALAGANGLGMMGYGIGKLSKLALKATYTKDGVEDVTAATYKLKDYIGLGATDTYSYAGLGQDMSINRYLSNGPTLMGLGYSRSPGAPVFVEQVSGAPTQFQPLAGAPTVVEGLHGLSATLM